MAKVVSWFFRQGIMAALILSEDPQLEANLTNPEVQNIIKQTADDLGPQGFDPDYGHGRINAYRALCQVSPQPPQPPAAPTGLTITNGGQIGRPVRLSWNANSEPDLDHYNVWRECRYGVYFVECNLHVIASTTSTSYRDNEVFIAENDGRTDLFTYYVTAVDAAGQESNKSNQAATWGSSFEKRAVDINEEPLPEAYRLEGNHPNPFNATTLIRYELPENSSVDLRVFDLLGREVKVVISGKETAGYKVATWDGKDRRGNPVPAGMYIYRLTAQSTESDRRFAQTRKLLLLK